MIIREEAPSNYYIAMWKENYKGYILVLTNDKNNLKGLH